MKNIYPLIPFLFLLLLIIFLFRYWTKSYKKRNNEVTVINARTYNQFFYHVCKRIYLMSIFLIIVLILKIIYILFW